jgi:chemotaxis protein CheZ
MSSNDFAERWASKLARLNGAFAAGDEAAFEATVSEMTDAYDTAETQKLAEVMKASDTMYMALARFRADSRLASLTHHEIPDARLRLDHVLTMTEEAANRTLDLIEKSAPLASTSVQKANELLATLDTRSHKDIRSFLEQTRGNFEAVRANLSEVMLAQSFQDLTGQMLRGVQRLIAEVETSLSDIARITGTQLGADYVPANQEGPATPGVTKNAVTAQSDVDDLIAGLGI